jgi:hypothetical protein
MKIDLNKTLIKKLFLILINFQRKKDFKYKNK